MMEENFRRIADAVRLPEGSRARIRAQIASRADEQEASMQNKPKKHLPRRTGKQPQSAENIRRAARRRPEDHAGGMAERRED